MLACLLGRLFTRAVNLLDGMVGSSRWRCFPRSVEVKSALISALSLALKDCISAALLYGRTAGVLCFLSDVGSCSTGLESPSAAFLASQSMDSFPAMLAWPGTQRMARWGRSCLSSMLLSESVNMSVREWLDEELDEVVAKMAAWLSTPM